MRQNRLEGSRCRCPSDRTGALACSFFSELDQTFSIKLRQKAPESASKKTRLADFERPIRLPTSWRSSRYRRTRSPKVFASRLGGDGGLRRSIPMLDLK